MALEGVVVDTLMVASSWFGNASCRRRAASSGDALGSMRREARPGLHDLISLMHFRLMVFSLQGGGTGGMVRLLGVGTGSAVVAVGVSGDALDAAERIP